MGALTWGDPRHLEKSSGADLSRELGFWLDRQGDVGTARAALQHAISNREHDAAPLFALILGILLDKQGDAEGARAAYQQAIDSGNAEIAPQAMVNLGILLEKQGDAEGARAAL